MKLQISKSRIKSAEFILQNINKKDHNMKGAYNPVAPAHITNNDFVRKISERLKRPFWLPNIPAIVIKLMFGEMSVMLLNGSRVSSERIIAAGYKFYFPTIDDALQNLYK